MIEHLDNPSRLALARAVNRLKAECPEDMKIFQAALHEELRVLDEYLREAEGTELHRAQGHAQRLDSLSEYLAGSLTIQRELIDRIRKEGEHP